MLGRVADKQGRFDPGFVLEAIVRIERHVADTRRRLGARRLRFCGVFGKLPRRALGAPPLAPGLRRWRQGRRLAQGVPIELDVRILRFEHAHHVFIQGLAPDPDVRRGAKPVQELLPHLAAAARRLLDEGEVLVAALVPDDSKEWHVTSSSDVSAAGVLRTGLAAPLLAFAAPGDGLRLRRARGGFAAGGARRGLAAGDARRRGGLAHPVHQA